ncbi:MAG: hypothetical protein K8L99_13435 [Anaerolineae bacterium]|nr:hypothetical protein [Anaerolineae bacterium]
MTNRAHQFKPKVEEVPLPSGAVVVLRHPNVLGMIMSNGNVPDALAQFVTDIMASGKNPVADGDTNNLPMLYEMANLAVRSAFISPKVVDDGVEPDYDHDEIAITDVQDMDKLAILNWSIQGGDASKLASFLEEQGNGAAAGPSSKPVSRKAKSTAAK